MIMSRKTALVDYNLCRPGECPGGECVAANNCPAKLLRQEERFAVPMPEPYSCRACGDCVRACPLHAIRLVNM